MSKHHRNNSNKKATQKLFFKIKAPFSMRAEQRRAANYDFTCHDLSCKSVCSLIHHRPLIIDNDQDGERDNGKANLTSVRI